MNKQSKFLLLLLLFLVSSVCLQAQNGSNQVYVGFGWANNSVNTVVFRKNSLVTWRDMQFIAFYSPDRYVVLGKRKHGTKTWKLSRLSFKGNASDAHNSISIMVDGDGFLHMAWDHHNSPLRYCRGIEPGSLNMSELMTMTGTHEEVVTYPEFYRLKNGDLLFLYRSGESGKGNLIVNYYNTKSKQWRLLHENLIDGEGMRNAYWQAHVDRNGTVHLSWVWRETADVKSNHDMCYARSSDGGKTWTNSKGDIYKLPINTNSAEYACRIHQGSELINQTSMTADENGNPYIATYWRDIHSTIPQYHIIYKKNDQWKIVALNFRRSTFTLSGIGTKKIPIARPQLVIKKGNGKVGGVMLFRDSERQSKASAVLIDDLDHQQWRIQDLTSTSVEDWEPTFDTEYWKESGELHIFIQKTTQIDNEGVHSNKQADVYVLEFVPGVKEK